MKTTSEHPQSAAPSRRVGNFIRSNVVGILALYVSLGGVAVASHGARQHGGPTVTVAKKAKRGPAGPPGPQGPPGLQGAQGPAGTLGTAAAGGDLTGTFPNPTIGTGKVTSAKLATNAIPNDGTADDGSTKLAANSVNYDELHIDSVRGNIVKDGSLTGTDIAPGTITAGALGTSALGVFPAAVVKGTADTSLASGATLVSFNSEIFDNDNLHSTTVNPSEVVAPVKGVYLAGGMADLVGGTASYGLDISSESGNDVAVATTNSTSFTGAETKVNASGLVSLSGGEWVHMFVQSTAGATLTDRRLSLVWVGPA